METRTLSRRLDFENAATETAPGLDVETPASLYDVGHWWPLGRTRAPEPALRHLWSNLGRWVIAVTASTTPVGYIDIRQEFRRSGASSIVWTAQRKRGHPISLRQAREIALAVLADTERRLEEERSSEARFLLELWDDEAAAAE